MEGQTFREVTGPASCGGRWFRQVGLLVPGGVIQTGHGSGRWQTEIKEEKQEEERDRDRSIQVRGRREK